MLITESATSRAVDPRFQIVWILLSLSVISLLFYFPVSRFHTLDMPPYMRELTQQAQKEIGGAPDRVKTGIFVKSFPELDPVKGICIADVTVWFVFDPKKVDAEKIGKFSFVNGKIKERTPERRTMQGDKMFARYNMRVEFTTDLHYANFPFNDHRISFVVDNYYTTPAEMVFQADESLFVIAPGVAVSGWEIVSKEVKTGYFFDELDPNDSTKSVPHPRIAFTMDLSKVGIRHIISIFLPLILIFFIALFSLSYNPQGDGISQALGLSVSSVTAMVAFRFVIENMAPRTGSFMMSDKVFLYFLVATFFIFFVNLFSNFISQFYKKCIIVALHIATIGMFAYFVVSWFI